jgi:histidine triad (HIT) family protein
VTDTDGYDPSCIFCAIVREHVEASFVHRDEHTVAFMDIRPVQPGHTLVIPRRHAQYMHQLDDETMRQLWSSAMHVYRAVWRSGIPMDALNLVVADGVAASQEIPHVHVHLVPRSEHDGFGFRFPPGYGTLPPRQELDAQADRIRTALADA